jgi:hypothetical protein
VRQVVEHPAHLITTLPKEGKTMTVDEIKPITDRLVHLCTLYQSTVQLMNEHEPQTHILENLNDQFRSVLDQLDQLEVLS